MKITKKRLITGILPAFIGITTGIITVSCIYRNELISKYSHETRLMALTYAWKMEDRKVGDRERVYNAIYNPEPWNLLKWKKEDFIKNKDLYDKVRSVYEIEKIEEHLKSYENDKTFKDRVDKLKIPGK